MAAPKDEHECKLRRQFKSREHAKAAAHRIAVVYGKNRQPEACGICNAWHLSESK